MEKMKMFTNADLSVLKQIRNLLALILITAIVAITMSYTGTTFWSQSEWLSQGWYYLDDYETQSFNFNVPAGQEITVMAESDNDVVLTCDGYENDLGGSYASESCVLTAGQHDIQIHDYDATQGYVWVELTQVSVEEPVYEEWSNTNEASDEISFGGIIELDAKDTDYFSGNLTDNFYVFEIVGADYEVGFHGYASGMIYDADGYVLQEFQETDFYSVLDEGKYFIAFTERDPELWISLDSTYEVWESSEEHTVQAGSTYEFEVSVTQTTQFVVVSDQDARIEIYDADELTQIVDDHYSGDNENFTLEPGDYTLKFSEWNSEEMMFIIKSHVSASE